MIAGDHDRLDLEARIRPVEALHHQGDDGRLVRRRGFRRE